MSDKWSWFVSYLLLDALLANFVISGVLGMFYFSLNEREKFLQREKQHLKRLAALPREEIQKQLDICEPKEPGMTVTEFLSRRISYPIKVEGTLRVYDIRRDGIECILQDPDDTLKRVYFMVTDRTKARRILAATWESDFQKDVLLVLYWDEQGKQVTFNRIIRLRIPD